MRTLLPWLLALVVAAPSLAQTSTPGLQYPTSAPARHAEAWFQAYNAGEDALRKFWVAHASQASLGQRPIEQRLQFMRQVRSDEGGLTPVGIIESGQDFIEVLARAEHGDMMRIRFTCEPEAPYLLAALRLEPTSVEVAPEEVRPNAGAPGLPVVPSGPPPTDAQIIAALSSEVDSLARTGEFSGTVMLDKDGRTLYAHAHGPATRERLNTLETRFNLGSLNKIFTHVAIEQLAQAGRLSLDDPVTKFLPDYQVPNAGRITIRMLLDHRGGVPDMLDAPDLARDPDRVRTAADWYGLVRTRPLLFEPGARQQYSNGGFVLLGAVIAAAAHEDYYDYIRRHVYAPAGMRRSDHFARDERIDDVAVGWTRRPGGGPEPAGTDSLGGRWANTRGLPGRGSAAGGGYATVGDLVRFANALRAGRLLDRAHVRDVVGEDFSLGIAGGSPGVNGLLLVAGPYTLAVLCNLDPPAAEHFAATAGRMVRMAAGLPPPRARIGGGR